MDADRVRGIVERHFRVYEERDESLHGTTVARLYFLQFPQDEFDARYEAVRRDLGKEVDEELTVFIRREGGEDILFVAPRVEMQPERNHINVVLLVLTILTTVTAGALYWHGYSKAGSDFRWTVMFEPENLLWGGLTFALPLMLILGLHESAHFVAARRHGLRASLPFFIPMPPPAFLFGTLGAFIRLRDPLPDRKALFDVGASGPIAGFALAVPVLILGGFLTEGAAMAVPDLDRPDVILEGDWVKEDPGTGSWRFSWVDPDPGTYVLEVVAPDDPDWRYTVEGTMTLDDGTTQEASFESALGTDEVEKRTVTVPQNSTEAELVVAWDDSLIQFGDPLLARGLDWAFTMEPYLTHPTYFAGWVGLLVTGINLLPAGQLDGGHVARAVMGERMTLAAYVAMGVLLYLSFQFSAWILMALFILLTGIRHPPPLNDRTELDWRRRVIAAGVLLVFVVSFIPVPLQI